MIDHPDIRERVAQAAARQTRAASADKRKKRIEQAERIPDEKVERLAYSVAGAAKATGINPATLFRWIKSGFLRASYVGGLTLIMRDELVRL